MSEFGGEGRQEPTEEQIRAFEEQLKRLRVEDVLVQTLVTLVNLGARRLGLTGEPEARDLDQARLAIEGARALMPLVPARSSARSATRCRSSRWRSSARRRACREPPRRGAAAAPPERSARGAGAAPDADGAAETRPSGPRRARRSGLRPAADLARLRASAAAHLLDCPAVFDRGASVRRCPSTVAPGRRPSARGFDRGIPACGLAAPCAPTASSPEEPTLERLPDRLRDHRRARLRAGGGGLRAGDHALAPRQVSWQRAHAGDLEGRSGGRSGLPEAPVPDHRHRRRRPGDRARGRARHRDRDRLPDRRRSSRPPPASSA